MHAVYYSSFSIVELRGIQESARIGSVIKNYRDYNLANFSGRDSSRKSYWNFCSL